MNKTSRLMYISSSAIVFPPPFVLHVNIFSHFNKTRTQHLKAAVLIQVLFGGGGIFFQPIENGSLMSTGLGLLPVCSPGPVL